MEATQEYVGPTIQVGPEAPKPVPPVRQVIDWIKWQDIPPHVRENIVMKTSRKFLTRNSACPCGSFRRYKNCCGKGTGV